VNIKPPPMIGALMLAWAGATSGAALAQTAEPPAQHQHMGGQTGHAGSGEGFHRRFDDAEKWAKEFDNPERDAWQKPEEVLDALHLQTTSIVADIGAGTGYFSVRIAKRVPEGKVFAADIEPDMVRYLAARAEREHLANLTPVQARADTANLPEPVDLVLVVDTYHHIDDPMRYFAALMSSLRPSGRLVIIDFKADSPIGPPAQHRIPPEQVTHELAAAGYVLTEKFEFLPRQYGLIFKKRDS
jgi:SAM-dependent methyltransferase